MNRKMIPAFTFIFLVLGSLGLYRYSQDVRTVDVVGLFASGAACGAALVALIFTLKNKS